MKHKPIEPDMLWGSSSFCLMSRKTKLERVAKRPHEELGWDLSPAFFKRIEL